MSVTSGRLDVKLPGIDDWVACHVGDEFIVEKGESFNVRAIGQVAYLCLYR